jgi:hypothetical protein
MQTITHYEVYEAAGGQWGLAARFSGSEQQTAIAHARGIEETKRRAAAVIEEIETLGNAQSDIRLIHRTLLGGRTVRPPQQHSEIGSRLLMVVLTGAAIGALVATGVAAAVSASGGGGSMFKMIMLGSFFMGAVIGSSLLFRMYVPVGLVLWNAKDPDSRKRTIMTLVHGQVVPPMSELLANPSPDSPTTEVQSPPAAPNEFQTSIGTTPPPPTAAPTPLEAPAPDAAVPAEAPTAPAVPVDQAVAADAGATAMESLIARNRALLHQFADQAMAEVNLSKPMLMPPGSPGDQSLSRRRGPGDRRPQCA